MYIYIDIIIIVRFNLLKTSLEVLTKVDIIILEVIDDRIDYR